MRMLASCTLIAFSPDAHEVGTDPVSTRRKVKCQEMSLTQADIYQSGGEGLSPEAKLLIPERVRYYAAKLGITYGRGAIRAQRSRWGSCSSKGNLNFNCLLMLTPREVIDSVIVHELCHRRELNHSKAFWALVYEAMPDYKVWDKWLKDHGRELISLLPR